MNNLTILIYNHSKLLFIFLFFLLTINITTFILMAIDKYRAIRDKWRVKEWTFILLAFVGGSVGVLLGMVTFRHKINKQKFYIGIPVIFFINFAIFYIMLGRIV